MEMTYEQWEEAKKGIKRRMSAPGWALLIYYAIMNVSVVGIMMIDIFYRFFQGVVSGDYASIESAVMNAAENAWGYFIAILIGLLILLIWKKPRYFREEIFAKGAPMKPGAFFAVLCVFFSGQMVFQALSSGLELILNAFGYSIVEGMESLQIDSDNFSMFLYAGILAPIAEEILFRGLIQRTMLPFGKRFAIFVSSLTFGLFHGNLIQAPYAFAVGLVLGYVAAEYNIFWAMVLHMVNNLVLGDMIYRILGNFPDETVNLIVWGIILAFGIMAMILLIANRKRIAAYRRENRMEKEYVKCYFSCAGTIVLLIIMMLNIISTTFMLIAPL